MAISFKASPYRQMITIMYERGAAVVLWNSLTVIGSMAAVLSAAAVYGVVTSGYRRARWYPAQAIVLRRETRQDNTGPPAWVSFRSGFAIARYTDHRGQEHTLKVPDHPPGTPVSILVNPHMPHRAHADMPLQPGICACLLIVTATSWLLLALIPHPPVW